MTKPTKWLCAQRRLRSAWASAQSDQSLRCSHEKSLCPQLPIERTAKTDQTGRMPRLIWVFAGRTLILLVLSCRGSLSVCMTAMVLNHRLLFPRNFKDRLNFLFLKNETHATGYGPQGTQSIELRKKKEKKCNISQNKVYIPILSVHSLLQSLSEHILHAIKSIWFISYL